MWPLCTSEGILEVSEMHFYFFLSNWKCVSETSGRPFPGMSILSCSKCFLLFKKLSISNKAEHDFLDKSGIVIIFFTSVSCEYLFI